MKKANPPNTYYDLDDYFEEREPNDLQLQLQEYEQSLIGDDDLLIGDEEWIIWTCPKCGSINIPFYSKCDCPIDFLSTKTSSKNYLN